MARRIAVVLVLAAFLGGCQTAQPAKAPQAPVGPRPTGVLVLMSDVMGAEVYIDGAFWANIVRPYQDGHQFSVPPGRHTVVVKSPGYQPYRASVEVMSASMHHLIVRLKPLPGADARRLREDQARNMVFSRTADLLITSDVGGAMVYVDGQLRGQIPMASEAGDFRVVMNLPAGAYEIVLKKEGFKDYRAAVYVNERGGNRIDVKMEAREKASEQPREN